MNLRIALLFVILSWVTILMAKELPISLLDYGVREAKNGEERYIALYRCHQMAVKNNKAITYEGIDTLRLDIPKESKPIPLPDIVDFAGVIIIVVNKQKDCFLFEMSDTLKAIDIDGNHIDKGDYTNNPHLKQGRYLVIVKDKEPWCGRKNYVSKVIRKDAMLVVNGKSAHFPISSYTKPSSRPLCWYREVINNKKSVRDLQFIRAEESTFKTYCFKIENQYKVELNNINIYTPDDSIKNADKAIHIENCVDVTLYRVGIHGTYSQRSKYGYGISLFNITDLIVNHMFARSKWGVFGTHCLKNVVLKNCDINRFDIHCYGRDVRAINCKFSNMYNQFSSVFGDITFESCTFENEIPVLIESSYNAYTPFELVFDKCTFYLNRNKNYLMTLFGKQSFFAVLRVN